MDVPTWRPWGTDAPWNTLSRGQKIAKRLERRRPNSLHGEAEKRGDSWSRPGVQGGILKRGDIGCSCVYPECSSRQGEPEGAEELDSNHRSKGERRFWKTMRAGMLGPREREAGRASEDPSTGAALPLPRPDEARPPAESETADVGVLRNQEMV